MVAQPILEFIAEGEDRCGDSTDMPYGEPEVCVPALDGAGAATQILGDALPAIQANSSDRGAVYRGVHSMAEPELLSISGEL